jgi:hypothetical protein
LTGYRIRLWLPICLAESIGGHMAIGLWREKNGWGTEHSVRVKYPDNKELDIPEHLYRSSSYLPYFDDLPWKAGGEHA